MKHHDGTGVPQVDKGDLFILIKDPLGKIPHFFVGHSARFGLQTVRTRCVAKPMEHVQAKAWAEFLSRAGHEFFLAPHEEKKAKPRIRIVA